MSFDLLCADGIASLSRKADASYQFLKGSVLYPRVVARCYFPYETRNINLRRFVSIESY